MCDCYVLPECSKTKLIRHMLFGKALAIVFIVCLQVPVSELLCIFWIFIQKYIYVLSSVTFLNLTYSKLLTSQCFDIILRWIGMVR